MEFRLLDSLRGELDASEDRLNFLVEQAHFVVHLEELSVRVVTHPLKDLLCHFLFFLKFNGTRDLHSLQLLHVASSLLLFLLFLIGGRTM